MEARVLNGLQEIEEVAEGDLQDSNVIKDGSFAEKGIINFQL